MEEHSTGEGQNGETAAIETVSGRWHLARHNAGRMQLATISLTPGSSHQQGRLDLARLEDQPDDLEVDVLVHR